jgi:hypothetical protein
MALWVVPDSCADMGMAGHKSKNGQLLDKSFHSAEKRVYKGNLHSLNAQYTSWGLKKVKSTQVA